MNQVVAEGKPSTKSFSKEWRTLQPMKGPFPGGAFTLQHGIALQTLCSLHEQSKEYFNKGLKETITPRLPEDSVFRHTEEFMQSSNELPTSDGGCAK